MPANIRALLAVLLLDLAADARRRSRTSWENRKVFVAAYWATVAVYAGHVARVLGGAGRQAASRKPFRVIQPGFPELAAEIGRAACRERGGEYVWIMGVAV